MKVNGARTRDAVLVYLLVHLYKSDHAFVYYERDCVTSLTSFWCFYCLLLTLTYFTHFSRVSIVDFEQVNVSWEYLAPNWSFLMELKDVKYSRKKLHHRRFTGSQGKWFCNGIFVIDFENLVPCRTLPT